MIRRELWDGGPEVGPVGFGAMGLSWAYGEAVEQPAADALVDRAIELGCTLIDTADMYGPFINEELVGRALAGRRDEVVLATKAGLVVHDAASFEIGNDGRPEHLVTACDASLHRLGVESVDLLYLHRIDPDVPVEESVGAMAELVAAGKVRAIGLSEPTTGQLERAHTVHPISVVQSELSLWSREPLDDVLGWCEAHGAGFVAYSPLGRGLLTGAIGAPQDIRESDFRAGLPRFADAALHDNLELVDRVRTIAERLQATPAQVALAWTLHQGRRVVPIPGTRRIARLEENIAAAELSLTSEDLAELDALPAATGARR